MERIPFGISQLDAMIGGGAPRGSAVLLAGDIGAGAREFLHTSAAMSGLARADPELFDLYYGSLPGDAALPEEVHYVSFTHGEDALVDEMAFTLEAEVVDAAVDAVEFVDVSGEYFEASPVPTEWYADRAPAITSLGEQQGRRDVLDAFGDYLTDNAPGNLVVVDSVTDLVSSATANERMDWDDITLLMKGLEKASHQWRGLILLLVNREAVTECALGRLMDSTDGTLSFTWESGGSERARTMYVQQFRGVLSRLEDENIIRFETEITDAGFDISDVRKIR